MPKLTVQNLTNGPYVFNDKSGLSNPPFIADLGPAGSGTASKTFSISRELLERLQPDLDAAKTAGQITWSWKDDNTQIADDTDHASVQALSGAGAASLGDGITELTATAAANAVTLADGSYDGQTKTFVAKAGYDGVKTSAITPANAHGFTTVVLAAAGHVLTLKWSASLGKWWIAYLNRPYTKDALTGAGAASVLTDRTDVTSSGVGQVVTVADGLYDGQWKHIHAAAGHGGGGGNTSVITPTHASGFTTVTLSAVGQAALLLWNATLGKWVVPGSGTVA